MSTITERIHLKADQDLRKKIDASLEWIWEEARAYSAQPKIENFPFIASAYTNDGQKSPTSVPWVGAVQNQFKEVAFAYLCERYRYVAVTQFMAKVNNMAAEMENLGISIQQREEGEP